MIKDKKILDACCGGRMFWYEKDQQQTLFMDKREVEKGAFTNNWNPNWCVKPDVIADFRDMPFPNNHFKLVIYDPPHLTSGSMKSVINKKYGLLNKDTWKQDLLDGFNDGFANNLSLKPGIQTLFLITPPHTAHISSTVIREIHQSGGAVESLIPFRIYNLDQK